MQIAKQAAGPFHIPSLDGIRAIAVSLVFLSHSGLGHIVPGGLGVTIFFFLSGYLITTLLRMEYQKYGRIDIGAFYIRRAFRIWPAFYLTLAVTAILNYTHLIPGTVEFAPLMAQLLHFLNYYIVYFGQDGVPTGSSVYWSLAVEEHFYLLFPLTYLALLRVRASRGEQTMVLLTLCVLILLWRIYLIGTLHSDPSRTYHASETRFDSLLFGCILAIFQNPALDPGPRSKALMLYVVTPAAFLLLASTVVYRSDFFRETTRYTLQGIALYPLFIAAIRYPDVWPFRFLNLGPIQFFGVLSYSFYLVHHTNVYITYEFVGPGKPLLHGLASFLTSLACAYAIYRYIEQPCHDLRQRFLSTRKRKMVHAAS